MKNYQYEIELVEMNNTKDDYRFLARIPYIERTDEPRSTFILDSISSTGKTPEEAKSQVITKIENWLNEQTWVIHSDN